MRVMGVVGGSACYTVKGKASLINEALRGLPKPTQEAARGAEGVHWYVPALGDHLREAGDPLIVLGPLFGLDFQKREPHPDFKKAGKARRCCLILASRVFGQTRASAAIKGRCRFMAPHRSRSRATIARALGSCCS